MQSKFINYPLYSNYYLNSHNVSVGVNECIGNHMMVGLVLSHFKQHHMLSNNNILTKSFNYVSLYGKYDFNNGMSIQNIIGTTYSVIGGYAHDLQNTNSTNCSHYYNNLKLDTKLYPFKNNSNILLTISNDITFFYTSKANAQQDLALDTSIKCSIGYIRSKVMTEIYYLLCCNIWNNEDAQTQFNKDSNIPLVNDFNIFHRHTIGTKLTIKTDIIAFSMSIGACFQNNYITNFGTLRLQVNF